MAGWLDKYDDTIVAQGGETIPLSREDYLRQQYQDYLKSQAEKGRKAVVEGREKFAKDYVIPAIKTAGSFTPAGPIIGLMDAYEAYQKGNTNSAIVSAGMEALPYGSKYIGKGIKALSNTLIDNKDAIRLAYYSKAPWTWKPNPNYYYRTGKGSEFLDDVVERNEIRAFNPNSYTYLRDQGLINGIRDVNTGKIALKAKTFPIADTYWSKGVPLDGRYSNQNYGDHIIEASDDIPFVNSVNQRTKQKGFWDAPDVNYNSTHVRGSYVKPRQSYGYDEKGEIQPSIGTPLLYDADKIKLYKPHWLKGYKEIPKKGQGGIVPKAQGGKTLERDMKESPFSFLIPERSGKGTGRTSKYFTELSNYYKGDSSYPYQYLSGSEYRPTMGNNEDVQYMSIQDEPFKQRIVEEFNKGKKKGNKVNVSYAKDLDPLGKFSIYEGKDDAGEYLSYYDKWDVNPLADKIGKPFELYDRIYVEKNAEGKYVPKKFAKGGEVKYTPEYVKKILPEFENTADNLGYHLDPKKIPTIGWGHRITEEELKRKAIKMGKEWIPYERFSGKEGRILADKLMEQDVSHHYSRLERQVGKDTLNTLPPEVQDVLLDITYNRGSLGDSLEYVKKGDIAGLRDYLAETSKGLKGGAKTRMEWRANRIPLKTLPPVETPIEYNTKDQYVPEVLQSIAEQPSTQSIIPIQDNEGYRNQENYGKPVQITSNQSRTPISMDGVPFPILAMSDTGELKIMFPGEEHEFEGGSVTELPMAQEGVRIKSDDRNWLQRTNDKVYSEYQEHKPQLFKDFPITDVVEPVISYLTGHSDPDTGLMNILPSANLPNKYYRRLTEGQISKAIREKGLVTPTVKEKGLTVTKSFPKKGQYILELSTDKPVSTNPLSISYGKTHPSQTYSFPDIVDLQSGDMKMFRRLNKKLIEVDPKLYGAPNKQALIDKQVVASMSPASGSLPTHHYAGEETLLSPHKIYKGGQNSPQLSLDKDYVWGIENVGRNKSTLGDFDPSRKNKFSPYIVNHYNSSIYQPIYDNPNVVYYPSTQPSKNKLTPFSKNIQKYVESLSDEISPDFKSPQMINSVRNYYKNHFGEDVSMLSNEDISKFIQKSYNESGAKGILYHSTNRPMTEYNPSFPAEEKIRKGWLGEGVYFSDAPSQDYGLLQEPFIHSGIEKKVIINDIYNPKNPTVRFTSPQKEVDDILKKISKPITRFNKGELSYRGDEIAFGIGKHKDVWNRFIKDKNVDAIYSATSTKGIGKNWPEIIIPPSSSVNLRSLYPHPELIEESLKTGRLNRDWNNSMINYEDGGNIQKSNQLRTFTKDSGWLNKYKEL